MTLSLKESKAITDMADLLYDFLPGSGNALWKGHVSFKTIAEQVGVGAFWQTGSKMPMLVALLGKTLEYKRDRFELLIVEIVRAGLTYRKKRGNPVSPEEIDQLNGLLLEVKFKFPYLWDPDFRAALSVPGSTRAKEHIERAVEEEKLQATQRNDRSKLLQELQREFFSLHAEPDRSKAGFGLERLLNAVFDVFGLKPREPFKLVGEQIDGSFELDHEIYLVEAKWIRTPCPEADLLVFRGKIEGKSKFTRGVFFSVNGISPEAEKAITTGKQPDFFVVNGYDLTMILAERMALVDFLRQRQRLLAEEGRVCVPFGELDV